jgi:purine-binding chemotaxis protein CheW
MADDQFVIFQLGAEHYGIGVSTVREIVDRPEITAVPEAPRDMVGVINLRDQVVPVIDLRTRLAIASPGGGNRLIVLELGGATVGGIVDGVESVQAIATDAIHPAASVAGLQYDYMLGVARLADRLVLLLDPGRLLSAEADELMREAARSSA